jgi:NADH-quinone oxidoreductase subunit M
VNGVQAVGAAIGVILGALYMLTAVQKMFFGPITRDENKKLPDVNGREILALAPLVLAIFIVGLAPNILLNQTRDAVTRVLDDYSLRVDKQHPSKVYEGPIKLGPRLPEAPKNGSAANATAPEAH